MVMRVSIGSPSVGAKDVMNIPKIVRTIRQSLANPVGHELVHIFDTSHGARGLILTIGAVSTIVPTAAGPAHLCDDVALVRTLS